MIGVSIAAWLILWWWTLTGAGHAHHPPAHVAAEVPRPLLLGLAWLTMITAMMLPPAGGFFTEIARHLGVAPRAGLRMAAAVAGFLAPWMAGGVALYLADRGLAAAAGQSEWATVGPGAMAGMAIAGAGAFQLTGAKRRSLSACRSPGGLIARMPPDDRRAAGPILRIGVAYGLASVACCWALMALTVMAAAAGMLVMMFFTAIMLIEGLTPWGPAFARGIGSALVVLGAAWALVSAAG